MKTAKEQIVEFIVSHYQKEKEKWLSGMKSHYIEWDDAKEFFLDGKEEALKAEEELKIYQEYVGTLPRDYQRDFKNFKWEKEKHD